MVKSGGMKKDTRLTFRVSSNLKKDLQNVAGREGRSVAQISEAFLKAGLEGYKKGGPKYLQRYLARQKKRKVQNRGTAYRISLDAEH